MYDTLGRRSSFLYRVIFSNLWLFLPVLDMLCKKQGGELNALMRTTCAFTQMEGSVANNVIPPQATVSANLRLIAGDTVESAVEYLEKTVNNPGVKISVRQSQEASITSDTSSDAWKKIKKAIEQTWTDALVSPYIMMQCSDSRHFNRISDKVMRFSAMELTKDERTRIHGNNERIPLEKIGQAVDFYLNLERQC
jgi:carboxypeptidase PM20D1